jgi:hypothetical protein
MKLDEFRTLFSRILVLVFQYMPYGNVLVLHERMILCYMFVMTSLVCAPK